MKNLPWALIAIILLAGCATSSQKSPTKSDNSIKKKFYAPKCQPASGTTTVTTKEWFHASIAGTNPKSTEKIMLIAWEATPSGESFSLKAEGSLTMKADGKITEENRSIHQFTCYVSPQGRVDNIVLKELTLTEKLASKAAGYSQDMRKDLSILISHLIIPRFHVEKFSLGDSLATEFIQMDHLVEGMRALEIKSIFKGYSFLNGKKVMVVETDDQVKKDKWTAKSKGRSFYDAESRYLLGSESEVVLKYEKITAYRARYTVSTIIYD